MKIVKSNSISAFGGMNFVFEYLNKLNISDILSDSLPKLNPNSRYSWKDLFYSFLSIYFCGGDCIEDIHTNLRPHFENNPYIKLPSPDTLLKRLSELATENQICKTKRGSVEHEFNSNEELCKLNMAILSKLGVLNSQELTLDYDNTIIFNEKSDSKMTYKRDYGYQPGVCTINEEHILYIENRNGNSDAKSFQIDTLQRMFGALEKVKTSKVSHFRADAASYQYEVIELLNEKSEFFYVGCRNSYVEKYFTQVQDWTTAKDEFGELQVGSILITPFSQQAREYKATPKLYRLLVKRRLRNDGQMNIITQDAYDYRAILTNNFDMTDLEVANFYAKRGNMERQFDILKNDFGWQCLPFSTLNKNSVFLYFSAICRNLYNNVINYFSTKCKSIKPTDRIKKFIFRFIILPAKWIKQSRQMKLKVYNPAFVYT
jgi:hypothetical protein